MGFLERKKRKELLISLLLLIREGASLSKVFIIINSNNEVNL